MKRLILVMAMSLGLILQMKLMAQKVYKDGSNKVILDLTEDVGMPAGAITNVKKYISFTPQANVLGKNNDYNGSINEKVYWKLEIASSDLSVTSWVNAFTGCKGLDTDWRLPTQRELMMIYIFRSAIEELSGTAFDSINYWSATEYFDSSAWYVDFTNGTTYFYYGSKTNNYRVRCVREIN